jgi:hypothetical protein
VLVTSHDEISDNGTRYKSYEGDRCFFSGTHSSAQLPLDAPYNRLGTALNRAFQNDDSYEAEMFHRHVRKVVLAWREKTFASDWYKVNHKKIEDKIAELNSVGWEILRKERSK